MDETTEIISKLPKADSITHNKHYLMNPSKTAVDNVILSKESEENQFCRSHAICLFGSFNSGKYNIVNNWLQNKIFAPDSYHSDERLYLCNVLIKNVVGDSHFIKYQDKQDKFDNMADLSERLSDLIRRYYKDNESICLSLAVKDNFILKDGTEIIIFPDLSWYFTSPFYWVNDYESRICVYVIRKTVTIQDKIHFEDLLRVMENVEWFIVVYDCEPIGTSSEEDTIRQKEVIASKLSDKPIGFVLNIHRIFFVSSEEKLFCQLNEFVRFSTDLSECRNEVSFPRITTVANKNTQWVSFFYNLFSRLPNFLKEFSEYMFPEYSCTSYAKQKKIRERKSPFSSLIDIELCIKLKKQEEEVERIMRISRMPSFTVKSSQSTESKEGFIMTADLMDQHELQARLEKTYEKLKAELTKCNEKSIEKPIKKELLINVKDFLDLYDYSLRKNIKKLMQTVDIIPDKDKLSLNCLCVSINIVNLLMDHVTSSSRIISRFFSYLEDFQCQDKSNRIARRMQETILYCVCNYYDSKVQEELKCIECDAQWTDTLENCFFHNENSNKIKLSAAIALSFNYRQGDLWRDEVLQYLTNIKSNKIEKETDKYLGIRGDFISAAIRKLQTNIFIKQILNY